MQAQNKNIKKQKRTCADQKQNLNSFGAFFPRASQLENYKAFFQYLVSGNDDSENGGNGELADES